MYKGTRPHGLCLRLKNNEDLEKTHSGAILDLTVLRLRFLSHDLQLLRDDMSLALAPAQLAGRLKVPLPPSPRHQNVSSNLDIKSTKKKGQPKTHKTLSTHTHAHTHTPMR